VTVKLAETCSEYLLESNCLCNKKLCVGERRGAVRFLVGSPEGSRPLGTSTRIWEDKIKIDNFYICTVHLDTTKVYYSPKNAQVIFLETILKFTLKQLRHVSVQSHHLQGAHYPYLLKLQLLK
jgi:hypothetical protein